MNFQTISAFTHPCTSRAILAVLTITLLVLMPMAGMAQRAIINPSTELPAIPNSANQRWDETGFIGWLTTHPVVTDNCDNGTGTFFTCRPMERWSTGFLGTLTATGAGDRWVELNADANSMIYQSVCMTNGESFGYSFVHRGRLSTTIDDVAQFRLGIPGGLPAGSKPEDSYSFPIATVRTQSDGGSTAPPTAHPNATVSSAAAGNGWVRYSGTYDYTGSTQLVNIGFVAISTAGSIGAGNFIDDWQVTLNPYLEFSPAAASGSEGSTGDSNTPANRPGIRVGGTVTAPVIVTFQVTGGTAVIGEDYSLTEPFQAGNTTSTGTVFIPAGPYDGVSDASLFPLPFSISADQTIEPGETVEFGLVSAPGATVASVAACGVPAVVNSTYTILNDDSPTAADAAIAGRVLSANGQGLKGVTVTLQGGSLPEPRVAMTSTFGYYSFEGIEAGEAYVVRVHSKRHRFDNQVQFINLSEDAMGINFIANP